MRKFTFTIILFSFWLFAGCSNDANPAGVACGVDDPIEDLAWLRNELNDYQLENDLYDITVFSAIYKGYFVIVIDLCCPACNTIPPPVWNCRGEVVGQFIVDIQRDELTGKRVLLQTHNGICQ